MGYTTEQLLLAAKVRELAVQLRTEAYDLERDAKARPMSSDEFSDWVDSPEFLTWQSEWFRRNPMETFVEESLKRIEQTADFIARRPK